MHVNWTSEPELNLILTHQAKVQTNTSPIEGSNQCAKKRMQKQIINHFNINQVY